MTALSRKPSAVVTSGPGENRVGFFGAKRRLRQAVLGLGQHDARGGVQGDEAVARHPREEPLRPDDALGLGAKRQRGAVALFVVEQVALVGLEGGEADRSRFGHVTLGEELDELVQVVAAVGDRRLRIAVAR